MDYRASVPASVCKTPNQMVLGRNTVMAVLPRPRKRARADDEIVEIVADLQKNFSKAHENARNICNKIDRLWFER